MTTKIPIRDRLQNGDVLLADGAMGTFLMESGLPAGQPPETWNIEHPDRVAAIHQMYIDAGSRIILTNSFGGTSHKLNSAQMGHRVSELNAAAASLATQVAGDNVYVAGDLGPTGELMQPWGTLSSSEAIDAFAAQASALVEGGVDLLWVETMMDLEEAVAAVTGAQQVTDLPIFCTLTFGAQGYTMMGVSAKEAAERLASLNVAAIGANCGEGVDVIIPALEQMRESAPAIPLIAKPNAGLPQLVEGETVYDLGPELFAERLAELIVLGIRVVGGCCGSTPDHIRALAQHLNLPNS
ncbi:MAG: homocysteine S-methyltransferase family protein [Chloroflexota bacterium]